MGHRSSAQDSFDEVNLIQKGNNYGWPEVEGRATSPGYATRRSPGDRRGLAVGPGLRRRRPLAGALRGERLWRVDVEATRPSRDNAFFVGDYGRLRTVVRRPDGNLWVTTSNRDGRGDPAPEDDRIRWSALAGREGGSRKEACRTPHALSTLIRPRQRAAADHNPPVSELLQALEDQLADPAGVGLAAHLLHHRADEGTGGGDLAVADLRGDVGVGLDRAVDGGAERAVVGDDGEPAGGDHLVGSALAGEHAVEDLAGELVVDRALVDQRLDAGDVGRGDRQGGDLGALLVGAPGQLGEPPLARGLREAPAAMVSSTRPSAPAPTVSRISRSEKPQSACSRARRTRGGSGSVARSSSTHSRLGATGTRSGSGK